jgi:hypothetical protein
VLSVLAPLPTVRYWRVRTSVERIRKEAVVLRIIGAGLPRSATLAQKIALETLGQGPCYHMVTVLTDLARVPGWQAALAGEAQWDEIFAGFSSSVDWPGSFFYGELMDGYPEAKVLLSVRDAQRWAVSFQNTILDVNRGDGIMSHLSEAHALIDPEWHAYIEMTRTMLFGRHGLIGTGATDEASLADVFCRYIDEVKATVPAGRLLVWAPTDGWEPLCEFVGAPVPDQPFPHVNDSAMFQDRVVEGALAALNDYAERRHTAR